MNKRCHFWIVEPKKQAKALIWGMLFCLLAACQQLPQATAPVGSAAPRHIILMIGDGMGPSQITALRYYLDKPTTEWVDPLPIDSHLVGMLRTSPHGKQGEVTDSAASATAYATGHKTVNGALSVSPTGESYQTVLEYAKSVGKSTGLVSTSNINHATPAAFASHVSSRRDYPTITRQMAQNPTTGGPVVDVMLGGGLSYFRTKNQDWVSHLTAQGYELVKDRAELSEATSQRLLGLFAPVGLAYAIDREPTVPSLAEMTDKALEALSANQNGFFLMVEASEIDWAAHDNDVVGVISELEGFMAAIERVKAFVKEHPDTLVLITADHATGGMSVGREIGEKSYYQWKPEVVASFRHSARWIATDAKQTGSLLKSFQKATSYPLSPSQAATLEKADPADFKTNLKLVTRLTSEITLTGWTTHGHTGVDVNLYAFGRGAEEFRGHHDNTYIGQSIFRLLRQQ